MKTGYVYNSHTEEIEDNYDLIWVVGTIGNQREPGAIANLGNIDGWKRGVVMWPKLSAGVGVNENASKLLELLNDLHYSDWNNGVPIIVDRFHASGSAQFNLDHLNALGRYITDNFNAQLRPLLRINLNTWNAWHASNPVECGYLLNHFELLLTQWGVTKPATVAGYGMPEYWEYADGYIKRDPTRLWETGTPPVVEPPVIPPPATGKKRCNIVIGGQIIGYTEEQ